MRPLALHARLRRALIFCLLLIALPSCLADIESEGTADAETGSSAEALTTCQDEYWWCGYYSSWCSDSVYSPWLQTHCPQTCDSCPTAEPEKETVNVMSWNMACRDVFPFSGCDNCTTRFGHIADAIDGKSGYTGLPDFDELDVIVGQELFTDPSTYQAITAALAKKGFTHVTAPAPDANSPQCGQPLQQNGPVSMGNSGGLVMWSRYPVNSFKTRRWCVNGFPSHQGYSAALIEVEGRQVVVFNMHMMPEYNVAGVSAEDLRMYQFSEIVNLAKDIDDDLTASGAAFSIIVGGDYNEDAYHLTHKAPGSACNKITDGNVKTKFNALGFDLEENCKDGVFGQPTWDPTNNDLAGRFSTSGRHEVLDYLIEYGSSGAAEVATNNVHQLSYTPGWSGQFCNDSSQGVLGGVKSGTAHSLSDHNAVVASFDLPPAMSSVVSPTTVFNAAFDQYAVQEAACGQASTQCVVDTNCCRSPEYAFDGNGYQCSGGSCQMCKVQGASCDWWSQGSECCGYNDYPGGLHCEASQCVRKFSKGSSCIYDHECDSHSCSWSWSGRRCD